MKMRVMGLLIGVLWMFGVLASSKTIPTFQSESEYGQVIELPGNQSLRDTKLSNLKHINDKEGMLVFSNSPECVGESGLLYREQVEGVGRLVVHHINQSGEEYPLRLVIRLENPTSDWTTGKLTKQVVKGPCEDILYTGQQVLYDYLGIGGEVEELVFAPYETKIIYESEEWLSNRAISGIIDFEVDTPLEWKVMALNNEMSRYIENKDLKILEKDMHPRGTYSILEKKYKVKVSGKEVEHFVIGEKGSSWARGADAITWAKVENKGDFGILQSIQITAKQDVTLLINPRGDLFKGAIQLGVDPVVLAPNKGELTGGNRVIIGGVIEKGETKELLYMLPNGSAAPVLFALVPHRGKNVEKLNKL